MMERCLPLTYYLCNFIHYLYNVIQIMAHYNMKCSFNIKILIIRFVIIKDSNSLNIDLNTFTETVEVIRKTIEASDLNIFLDIIRALKSV